MTGVHGPEPEPLPESDGAGGALPRRLHVLRAGQRHVQAGGRQDQDHVLHLLLLRLPVPVQPRAGRQRQLRKSKSGCVNV